MGTFLIILGLVVAVGGWLWGSKVERDTSLLGALPLAAIRFGSLAGAAWLILAGILVAAVG